MTATCDARTNRTRASATGFERVPCGQRVGLRRFTDRDGETRRYCALEGHRYDVERRYGVADPPEPDWELPEGADPVTASQGYAEGYADWTEGELAEVFA
jgi:hypothetical protein